MGREESDFVCVYCKNPILADESMRMAGDGTDRNFAHSVCYWRRRAEYYLGETNYWIGETERLRKKIEAIQEVLEDE